jgi:selenocysteine lyase/cysteine desulfurase
MQLTEVQVDWEKIRSFFNHSRDIVQLGASQFFSSHPFPVRQAILQYSQKLDESPVLYTMKHENDKMQHCREEVASYFGITNPDEIALTDSTTMGLGMIYTGLNIQPGDEILTTDHDHYSQHESIRQVCNRTGATYRRFEMYKNLSEVSKEEIVNSVVGAIRDETRILGITWVHSSSGLKIPVPEISKAVALLNHGREGREIRIVVDGVHGFGIEMESFPELGCDFFISSGHKWIYGPRGTGFVAATHEAWQQVTPVIPSYTDTMDMIIEEEGRPDFMDGKQMTPGGFHSLEYRWALADAFRFIKSIGKENIYERVHYLNRICKEGLVEMPHVRLHTPMADEFSAGIISFEVDGYSTPEVIKALQEKNVVATAAPYRTSWARFTPGIINTEQEIEMALNAVLSLKK